MIKSILEISGSVFSILKRLAPSREYRAGKKAAEKDVMEKVLEDVRLAEGLRRSPDRELARRMVAKTDMVLNVCAKR